MKFDISLYNDDFFKWHLDHVHDDEIVCGKELVYLYKFRSIVDFGCGIGSFLLGASHLNAEVKGYEISAYASTYIHSSMRPHIKYTDCAKPMKTKKYDCALCIEVAEHIEEKDSRQLIENITNASDFVIFTAATPGQEGTGHINCHEKEWWCDLFEEFEFHYTHETEALKEAWHMAPDYVLKNLMVFVRV